MDLNQFIEALIKEGEGEQIEYMAQLDLERIGKTVCAFLNTKGGRLIIGVEEQKKIRSVEDVQDSLNVLTNTIYSSVRPSSIISIRKEPYKDSDLILIEVIEGNKKPYSFEQKTYVRSGALTRAASEIEMSGLIRNGQFHASSWERTPCFEAELEHLDLESVADFIIRANKLKRSEAYSLDRLDYFYQSTQLTNNGKVTNGAVVLFGNDPTFFIPQCSLRIVEFPQGKTGDEFNNTVLIEDNLFTVYHKVQNYFKQTLPIRSKFSESNWRREDEYQYPLKALDEAVINAIMHRDYSDASGEVFIGVYPDRIEITNSGELPHFLTDSKLKKKHDSIPPNPVIAHVVFLSGIIEKVGRGTILINDEFKDRSLPSPTWESKNGFTKLTLFGKAKEIELNERMLRFLTSDLPNSISRQDYEDFLVGSISEKTARNDLSDLVDGGYLNKEGRGSATRYERTGKPLPEDTGGNG